MTLKCDVCGNILDEARYGDLCMTRESHGRMRKLTKEERKERSKIRSQREANKKVIQVMRAYTTGKAAVQKAHY